MADIKLIQDALTQYAEDNLDDWGSYGAYINNVNDERGQFYTVPGIGSVTIIDYFDYDHNKNYDSWTEHMWIIFKVGEKLYRATGTYTSYEGAIWDNKLTEVQPVEKTIIEYQDKD